MLGEDIDQVRIGKVRKGDVRKDIHHLPLLIYENTSRRAAVDGTVNIQSTCSRSTVHSRIT